MLVLISVIFSNACSDFGGVQECLFWFRWFSIMLVLILVAFSNACSLFGAVQ